VLPVITSFKKRLGMNYSGSAIYHSLQNVLSCCLLSKSVKNEVHNVIVKAVVFYACKTLALFGTVFWRQGMGQKGNDKPRENHVILYVQSLPDINEMIKSSRMRFLGCVLCMGEMGNAHRLWVKNQKGLDHFEKRTVFNYILMEHGVCEVNSWELV